MAGGKLFSILAEIAVWLAINESWRMKAAKYQ